MGKGKGKFVGVSYDRLKSNDKRSGGNEMDPAKANALWQSYENMKKFDEWCTNYRQKNPEYPEYPAGKYMPLWKIFEDEQNGIFKPVEEYKQQIVKCGQREQ